MDGSKGSFIPDSAAGKTDHLEQGFEKIEALLETMGNITLSQVCTVTGLEPTTIQNWIKRGWVANPVGKKYEERHIARILIIDALKECFKLEQIASLMNYVNNCAKGSSSEMYIKESELYSFLKQALQMLGQVDDLSRSGVEAIVDKVIALYDSPNIDAHMRIRKALTVMIYACVCTNVKRGTEAMMQQILDEYENSDSLTVEPDDVSAADKTKKEITKEQDDKPEEVAQSPVSPEPAVQEEPVVEARKTIAQALREWEEISASDDKVDNETVKEIIENSSKTWLSKIGLGGKDAENSENA